MKKLLLLVVACCAVWALHAQNYSIYPIPQKMMVGTALVSFTTEINVVCEAGIDQATKDRLQSILSEHGFAATFATMPNSSISNIYLGIDGSNGVCDQRATSLGVDRSSLRADGKFDRHVLHLYQEGDNASLLVLGEHTDAVFFALASLEQMLDQYAGAAMPTVTICDYADLQTRGLVEGYYGYPYSISVKKDLMRFMMRYKMNTYLYGAKSDPYHSEQWTAAYPTSITAQQEENGWLTQNMIREITQQSAATKVNFIWAIHPGSNFINSSTVVNDILGKFDKMYRLGVRQFAIFVDDVGLPSSSQYQLNADRLTAVQRGLEAKYNTVGAAPEDTVRPVHFVPQVYATGWVNTTEREGFYTALASTPKNVVIYTTGWGVWSIPNSSDLNIVRQYLGRDVAWWWNYPCNDNADGQIYTKDMYANFYEMPSVNSSGTVPTTLTGGIGIVSNPMQEGEVSKVALFSVADYSWNTAAFNNENSYQAAVRAVVGDDDADDFAFLSDYLRWNDPTDFGTLLSNVKSRISSSTNTYAKQLRERLERLRSVCAKFVVYQDSPRESDRLLYRDLSPWLLKLQAMVESTLQMMDVAQSSEPISERWPQYIGALEQINALSTSTDYTAYALEGMGSSVSVSSRQSQPSQKYFLPFADWLHDNILSGAFGSNNVRQQPFSNLPEASASKLRAHYSSKTNGYYLSASSLEVPSGCFIGISLQEAVRVAELVLDASLREAFTIRVSEDFRTWQTLSDDAISPQGFVKYVTLTNEGETSQTVTLSSRYFSLIPEVAPAISSVTVPTGDNAEDQPLSNLTDGDYTTWWAVKKNQANGDTYVLTLADETIIRDVRICFGTKNDDFMNAARVEVSADGSKWTALRVKGLSTLTFNLNGSYAVQGGSEMKYVDFDGNETSAKYVRLLVTNANTSKWLRLFEFEVNKHSGVSPRCYDGAGNALFETYDLQSNTAAKPASKSLVYRFVQPYLATSLTLYSGSVVPTGVGIEVTEDGETWTYVDNLTSSVQQVALSAYPNVVALRLTWTGDAPVIYEIVEENDHSHLLSTAIRTATISSPIGVAPLYDLQGRRVYQPQRGHIYIQGGHTLLY